MSKAEAQQPARRRLRVADLHPHLMCVLCGGYYVDATTIIECLHSFCKSCLVRYLESNKYCPICEVQVHKTKPLQNIRPDETLQNMVYKLVPGLFHREMKFRQEFYAQHPEAGPTSPEDRGVVDPIECEFYSPEELVSLALEFKNDGANSPNTNGTHRRYLRCPAAVTIAHLQKLVRNKFSLEPYYNVEVMFDDKILMPDFSIMDVAYSFHRKRKEQFHFSYRIVDAQCKRMKLEAPSLNAEPIEEMDVDQPSTTSPASAPVSQPQSESKSKLDSIISRLGIAKQTENVVKKEKHSEEWKEVQLQISENGVMSVTDISSIDKLIDTIEKNIRPAENSSVSKDKSVCQNVNSANEKKISFSNVKLEVDSSVYPGVKSVPLSVAGVKKEEVKDASVPVKSDQAKTSNQPLKMELKEEGCSTNKLATEIVKKEEDMKVLKTEVNETKIAPPVTSSLASKVSPVSSAKQNISIQKVVTSTVSSSVSTSLQSNVASVSIPSRLCTVTSGSNSPLIFSSVSVSLTACAPHTSLPMFTAASSKSTSTALTTTMAVRSAPVAVAKPVPTVPSAKKSSSSPVGYKTLKCGPKNWNPTISRNSFLSSKQEQQPLQQGTSSSSAGKPVTPPRFFKMRNTPRYLGNPASGVKAMYQVPDSKPETPPPAKSPSVTKLDPRTLSPIVSNASSPTSKSPVQPKGRPPFPSTTLSAQVSSHMPSTRSVATTTTTTSATTKLTDISTLRSSPSQPIVNPFLSNPFVHKGMPNFLYGGLPGLLPSGAAQFASMLRPGLGYPPVALPQPGMLFNPHSLHRQLSASTPNCPTSYPSSLSSSSISVSMSPSSSSSTISSSKSNSSGQRTPAISEKPISTPNTQSSPNRSNRSNVPMLNSNARDPGKLNGAEPSKNSVTNKPKPLPSPSQELLPLEAKTKATLASLSTLSKDSKKLSPSASDNNNTVSISKTKVQSDKIDGGRLSLDISKILPKETGKCNDDQLISRSKTPTSSSFQAQQS